MVGGTEGGWRWKSLQAGRWCKEDLSYTNSAGLVITNQGVDTYICHADDALGAVPRSHSWREGGRGVRTYYVRETYERDLLRKT